MSMHLSAEQLDNILVKQKDEIISLINDEWYLEAIECLRVLYSLWNASNYHYKYLELKTRLLEAIKLESIDKVSFEFDEPQMYYVKSRFNKLP